MRFEMFFKRGGGVSSDAFNFVNPVAQFVEADAGLQRLRRAGVAAMGLEKIDFIWYVKKISGLALVGYLAGAIFYIVEYNLLH